LQWEAFSLPELDNFLKFLNTEEKRQIKLIEQNCDELKRRMEERMKCLASDDNLYGS